MQCFRLNRSLALLGGIAIVAGLHFLSPSIGNASLQVFPTRVVLSDKQRSAQVSVRHHGKTPMRYRVSAVFYRMKEDGAMELVKDAEKERESAISLIRFSPRQVVLQPQVEQVVRIMFRKPAALEEGEYRAHLHFEGIDQDVDGRPANDSGESGAQMFIRARMAVAIPVIVRQGNPGANAKLMNPSLVVRPKQQPSFSVELVKTGEGNLFGDFRVFFTGKNKKPRLIGVVNGVSSYIEKRLVSYPLLESQDVDPKELGPGILKVELRRPAAEGGQLLAEVSKQLE